jgi:UDPglucose 6-dehydrogenase
MKIGIIGVGVVGGALKEYLEPAHEVVCYDKHQPEMGAFAPLLDAQVIFMAVPTPTLSNGNQDKLALFENCIRLWEAEYKGVIAVKSTVLPGTCEWITKQYGLRIVHNPEFLTAASPREDMINQTCIILGGTQGDVDDVQSVYSALGLTIPVLRYRSEVTEMVKYMHNLFLATKVGFCNDISESCQALGIDYSQVREAVIQVGQIGDGHTMVPGPDGKPGFGGMCFPKDTAAFLSFAEDHKLPMSILGAVVAGNRVRRPE